MFAEDLESNDGGLLEQNAQQFDGLYNSIECRETWAARRPGGAAQADRGERRLRPQCPAPASRRPSVRCGACRRRPLPSASRSRPPIPTLLLSGAFDWLTPPAWGREAARHLPSSRHVVFRAQGHGVVVQDPCAARLRDAFIEDPDPKRAVALPRRHAAQFHRRLRAGAQPAFGAVRKSMTTSSAPARSAAAGRARCRARRSSPPAPGSSAPA